MTRSPAVDELLAAAIDTAADRDRWKHQALALAREIDGTRDDHDPLLWRIWQTKAEETGHRLAHAERALRCLIKDPHQTKADTGRNISAWRKTL